MSIVDRSEFSLATLMEGATSVLAPLDASADYWRAKAGWLFPMYVLAMGPHAVVAGLLIDAIAGERRTLAAEYCWYLTAATIWRWIWLAKMQQRVQDDLRAEPAKKFWPRVPQILLLRLFSSVAAAWGSLLILPGFYGLFLGSFAGPLLLENDEPSFARVRLAIIWIHHSGKRLLRICVAMLVVAVVMLLAIMVTQMVFVHVLLPSLMGIDTADMSLTLESWAWRLSTYYFIFLVIDAFWTVAAVFLYYDSQSRRTATDLQARLTVIGSA